tara:strand:+ start:469 stop:1173 length:705 start_codon:yes stop_codon:yes gene_type:complete
MVFTPEQIEYVKKQILVQVDKMPQENKEEIKEQIKSLNGEQLDAFLKQNNIQVTKDGQLQQKGQEGQEEVGGEKGVEGEGQCIFCSIVQGKMPSYKIAENKKAVAILEINPLSKGHSIVLPLEHIKTEKLPKSVLGLAQKIAKKIKTKLKPEDIKIETSSFMGHAMVNVIPIYKDGKLEKSKEDEKDLIELQSKLETKKRGPRKKKAKTENKVSKQDKGEGIDPNLPQISFRIP